MDQRKQKHTDPWEEGVYGTGNTVPPENHGGFIALLLITVIFLSGIVSVLSVMNIQLYQELNQQREITETMPMAFSAMLDPDQMETRIPDPEVPLPTGQLDLTIHGSPASTEEPSQDSPNWQEICAETAPSVVSVSCDTGDGTVRGTGVILSENGYIVTNCHLLQNARNITVRLPDGQLLDATAVGCDAVTDLAVVYVEAVGLQSAQFGNSDALQAGDPVVAIGDPGEPVFSGAIADTQRQTVFFGRSIPVIQIDKTFPADYSGGPLLNIFGQVVGINTVKQSTASDVNTEVQSAVIPSTTVEDVVEQLINQGYVSGRPTLGISGEQISQFDQVYFQIPEGLRIRQIDPDSSAAKLGIEPGDVLIALNDVPISTQESLTLFLGSFRAGDTLQALFLRNGQAETLSLTVDEFHG